MPLAQQSLLGAFALDLGLQWVGWAVAALLQTEAFYDLTGSITFVALSLLTLFTGGATALPRARIASALVCIWARLLCVDREACATA